ncbi:MAG: hypothetical protein ACK4J2_08645 [Sulfurihydrogenibium azorense]|uniref:hypothetical protein n=1 Tax=Sulfurihydrogenibium azorense TaxID=309806 RepID=UPI00391B33A7
MDKPLLFIESFLDTVKRFDAYDLSIILIFGISLILTSAIAIIQKPPKKEFFIASSVIIFLTIYSIIENIKIVIANADETLIKGIPYRIQRGLFEASGYFLIPAVHDQIILLTLIPSLIIIYKTMRFLAVEYKALQLNIPYTASIKPETRPQIGTNQQQEQSNQPPPQKEENQDKETLQDPESKKYGKII